MCTEKVDWHFRRDRVTLAKNKNVKLMPQSGSATRWNKLENSFFERFHYIVYEINVRSPLDSSDKRVSDSEQKIYLNSAQRARESSEIIFVRTRVWEEKRKRICNIKRGGKVVKNFIVLSAMCYENKQMWTDVWREEFKEFIANIRCDKARNDRTGIECQLRIILKTNVIWWWF